MAEDSDDVLRDYQPLLIPGGAAVGTDYEFTDEEILCLRQAKKGDKNSAHDFLHSRRAKRIFAGGRKIFVNDRLASFADTLLPVMQSRISPDDPIPTLFITVPSTSGDNQIPRALGAFLAEKYGTACVNSDEYVDTEHEERSISVDNDKRFLYARFYVMKKSKAEELQALAHYTNEKGEKMPKRVVIVEDVLTTGSSAYTFARFLHKNGIQPTHVVAVKGDPDISPRREDLLALQTAAKKQGLTLDMIRLGVELARSEITSLRDYIGKGLPETQKVLSLLYAVKVDGNMPAYKKYHQLIKMRYPNVKAEQRTQAALRPGRYHKAGSRRKHNQETRAK